VLALEICEEFIGEKLLSENDLLCAAIHKENEKDGSELRPCHFVFAAFDHREADSGDTCSVSEFSLREIEHFTQSNEIVCEDLLIFFDFFFGKRYHICIILHYTILLDSKKCYGNPS
jgi:hypothetical protein